MAVALTEVAIKASGQCGWQHGLLLLGSMPTNAVTISTAIGICWKLWEQALCLLSTGHPTAASYTAAITACRQEGQWKVAICLLQQMQAQKLSPGALTVTAAINCCEASQEWQQALSLLSMLVQSLEEVDAVAYRSVLGCCVEGHWQQALDILETSWAARVHDTQSYTAVLWSCEAAACWQVALELLHEVHTTPVPDAASYLSVVRSCGKSSAVEAGIAVLWSLMDSGIERGVSALPCAVAALFISDPIVIHFTLKEAFVRLRAESNHPPQELTTLWSALAVLGARNGEFADAVLCKVIPNISAFDWDELMELSWGAAASGMAEGFFDPLQEELVRRIVAADTTPPAYCIVGLISACHAAGFLHEQFYTAASRQLQKHGSCLDGHILMRPPAAESLLTRWALRRNHVPLHPVAPWPWQVVL